MTNTGSMFSPCDSFWPAFRETPCILEELGIFSHVRLGGPEIVNWPKQGLVQHIHALRKHPTVRTTSHAFVLSCVLHVTLPGIMRMLTGMVAELFSASTRLVFKPLGKGVQGKSVPTSAKYSWNSPYVLVDSLISNWTSNGIPSWDVVDASWGSLASRRYMQ